MRPHYEVYKNRCFDGVSDWEWTLWIDDYAWDSYSTEAEAWAAADKLEAQNSFATASHDGDLNHIDRLDPDDFDL